MSRRVALPHICSHCYGYSGQASRYCPSCGRPYDLNPTICGVCGCLINRGCYCGDCSAELREAMRNALNSARLQRHLKQAIDEHVQKLFPDREITAEASFEQILKEL